ncbi:MAG: universal stress protein [Desulfohalobiaceae bacterium]|nr:universal stress protein [Desulfohalobiaceae bacterium]
MFAHILVPTDTSPESGNALQIAGKMQSLEKSDSGQFSKISLLHVVEVIAHEEGDEFAPFYSKLIKKAEAKMDELIRKQETKGLVIEKQVIVGNRVREILNFAETNKVDLILLKSHRMDKNDLTRGWGTISHKIGILSPCPVMLVR